MHGNAVISVFAIPHWLRSASAVPAEEGIRRATKEGIPRATKEEQFLGRNAQNIFSWKLVWLLPYEI